MTENKDPFGITDKAKGRRRSGGPVKDRILEKDKAVYDEDDKLNESLHESKTDTVDRETSTETDA